MKNLEATASTTDLARSLRVLVLAPVEQEASLIAAHLHESGISVSGTPDISSLASAISEGAGAAVLTEEALHGKAVEALAQQLTSQPPWSDFPIIVFTGGGTTSTDTDLGVRSGAALRNVVFLERPIRPVLLTSAVRSALAARQRQYEIRDYLLDREHAENAMRQAQDALESAVEQRTAALRRLSARLLRVQDEERRHVARELHDSLGQYLIAAKINLDLFSGIARPDSNHLRDAQQLIERAISDMRTLSHLLHPPLLDEAGFSSAARWYVDGFGKRSGITTTLDIPDNLQRLPADIETALFRILQEALTNVHRHSQSSSVEVRFTTDASCVALAIHDHGKGISQDVLRRFRKNAANSGVGLAGMRERVKELGGTLHVESSAAGTLLTTMIPIPPMGKPRPRRSAVSTVSPGAATLHAL